MNDVDAASSKRGSPSSSSSPSFVKRPKIERHDAKLDCYTPPPFPLTAPHGVERIILPSSLNVNRVSSEYLAQLTSERINVLRGQGRHILGLPVVLNDGIILNWVRNKSGLATDLVRSSRTDDNSPVVCQSTTWFAERRNRKPHLPVVSTRGGSGTSATDAIIIDSDGDMSGVSLLSRTDKSTELSINRGTSLNVDVINCSDSGIELLSSVRSENRAEDDTDDSIIPPVPFPLDDPAIMAPSRRTLTREEVVVALSGLRSDNTNSTSSGLAVDGTGKEMDGAEGVDGSRFPTRHTNTPSLRPIRKLLARGKRRGDPEQDTPLKRPGVAPGVSKKRMRKEFLEETLAITSSEGEEELDRPTSDPQLKRVPLPSTDYGRARRLLMPESADLPLVAVTMRGDCHFIERKQKYRISGYSLPNPGVFRHVGDVCMVGNTAVLGCDKGTNQISFLSVAGRPRMIDVTWSPHSSGPRYQDTQRRGVSRLAAVHAEDGHIKFLSGGYDGTIHQWTAGLEKLSEPHSKKVVSHASAQKRLHITDLNRSKTMTYPCSNDIQQIHIHPQATYVTLLEVRHLDRQIQLYDSRKGNFNHEPCLSFGHRNANGSFSGMHTRGSVHLVHFAMASEDRGILLWDFRNCKRAVIEKRFQQAEKVVHSIFVDSDIATFGQGVVTFFEDYLAQ